MALLRARILYDPLAYSLSVGTAVQMMDSTASCRWDWVRFWRFGATLLAA